MVADPIMSSSKLYVSINITTHVLRLTPLRSADCVLCLFMGDVLSFDLKSLVGEVFDHLRRPWDKPEAASRRCSVHDYLSLSDGI